MNRKPSGAAILLGAAAAALVLALWPYAATLANPLVNDDWIHLHRARTVSVFGAFSPHTIWFYRPLQTLAFQMVNSLAGLQPVAYNVLGRIAFVVVAALWLALLQRLFRRPLLALLGLAFFVLNWEIYDAVAWASCYGTLFAFAATLVSLHATLTALRTGARVALGASLFAAAAALLSKETAVHLPLLTLAIALVETGGAPLRERLRRSVRVVVPVAALCAVYVAWYGLFVTDIETVSVKGYTLVPPLAVMRQLAFALEHVFVFFTPSPLLATLDRGLGVLAGAWPIVPAILAALALKWKDRALLLGLSVAAITLFPQVMTDAFHASRFYFVPAAGAGLAWAALIARCFHDANPARSSSPPMRLARAAVALLVVLALLRSQRQLAAVLRQDRAEREIFGAFTTYLTQHRAELPRDACYVFDGIPGEVSEGFGLREMVKVVLDSENAEGIRNGSKLEPSYVIPLNRPGIEKILLSRDEEGKVRAQALGPVPIRKQS